MAIFESSAQRADDALVEALRRNLLPMPGTPRDHDALLALIGSARFALLGEASHGTREHNAEEYYRTMFRGRVSSWNLRDSHMVETLQALDRHLGTGGASARIAVWAHNSHLGDASATEMGTQGEWNVGQLVRDRYGADAVLVGFSTYRGWVTAATDWDDPPHRKRVRDGLAGSWEDLFHRTETERFVLRLRDSAELRSLIASPRRLQRAIGVIYRPEAERQSHYFYTRLGEQFDAMIHIDQTHALEPLDKGRVWHNGEAPETYPSGV